ncbi:MAG: metallophosphoesterase [Syntrophales bacterium LBB04]|nr:metallophosphoesterase [Syntrophales bacterium LBB04]
MSFRIIVCLIVILINYIAYRAIRLTVKTFLDPPVQRRFLLSISAVILLLNLPLLFMFYRHAGSLIYRLSPDTLRMLFFPTSIWLITLMIFLTLAGPLLIVAFILKCLGRAANIAKGAAPSPCSQQSSTIMPPLLSRRNFLAGSGGLLIPGIFAVAGYDAFGSMGEIDITPEHSITIPYLPRSMDGLRIVQLSDIHVGPYLGKDRLRQVVDSVNKLKPDLVFITGDIIDRSLSDLPEALQGLAGISGNLGTYAILGNHDVSSDPYSRLGDIKGGVNIARGLNSIGIQTLRNENIYVGAGQNRLALLGLDWLSQPGDRRFYSYRQQETRIQLQRMMEKLEPETPTILLAHHPDTFRDSAPMGIGLTMAGHTHGGQVVLGNVGGIPIGIGPLWYRYVSGLYQINGSSLYVNRGIGYLGIPIRINCNPEISRFKLVCRNS